MSAAPSKFFFAHDRDESDRGASLGYAPDCEYLGDWPESVPGDDRHGDRVTGLAVEIVCEPNML